MKDLYRQIYLENRRTLERLEMDPERAHERDEREAEFDGLAEQILAEQRDVLNGTTAKRK
jgi:hypothetical protein